MIQEYFIIIGQSLLYFGYSKIFCFKKRKEETVSGVEVSFLLHLLFGLRLESCKGDNWKSDMQMWWNSGSLSLLVLYVCAFLTSSFAFIFFTISLRLCLPFVINIFMPTLVTSMFCWFFNYLFSFWFFRLFKTIYRV